MIKIWINKKGNIVLTFTNGFHYSLLMHDIGYRCTGFVNCAWSEIELDDSSQKLMNKKQFFNFLDVQKSGKSFFKKLWRK